MLENKYRVTTRSIVVTEYIVKSTHPTGAVEDMQMGKWESEDVINYELEQVLKIEDLAYEVD